MLLSLGGGRALAGETGKGKYAGEFLSLGVGARALGMGGAFVALSNDVTSVYWNAAGLSQINYPQISLMHAEQFGKIVQYNFGAFAVPYGTDASIGFGVVRLAVDDIPLTRLPRENIGLGDPYVDENGVTRINRPFVEGTFSDSEYGFFLSYGRRATQKLSYGGSVKIVRKGFHDAVAWGLGFDLSAQVRIGKQLLLGANFQDATTTILAWNTGRKEIIIPTLKLGAALPLKVKFLKGTLLPAVDADIRFEGRDESAQVSTGLSSVDFHAGLEYTYRNTLSLRIGSDTGYFSAGAGINLPKLQIDYAFMSHPDLDTTHRISLKISIEEVKFRRK